MGRRVYFSGGVGPTSPAGAVVIEILATLRGRLREHEAGVLADEDIEALHDYRVALRRTRSCLGQLRRTLPRATLKPIREEFSWLGKVTGPTRDLDVFLADLKQFEKQGPAGVLYPIVTRVQRDRDEEQVRMVDALRSTRCVRLFESWDAFLANPPGAAPADAPDALRAVGPLAAGRIQRGYKKLRRCGRSLDAQNATDELHRLRLSAKKLRYLIEFLGPLFDREATDPLLGALKRLQDTLGSFNDLQVQQQRLARYGAEIGSGEELQALLERLAGEETRTRKRFAKEFETFASPRMRERIRELNRGL